MYLISLEELMCGAVRQKLRSLLAHVRILLENRCKSLALAPVVLA